MCIRDSLKVEQNFKLMNYLSAETSQVGLKVSKKEELFRYATELFAGQYQEDISPIVISTALWEREQMQNTSVGNGVAMPHATLARAPESGSHIAILTTEKPIDYGSPDGKKCDVFFFTLGPPSARTTHLKILAELSRLILNTDLLDQIRAASTSEELIEQTRMCLKQVH